MTLLEKQQAFTLNVAKLIEFIYSKGYSLSFGETYRTPEQAILNEKKGIGVRSSLHCKKLAVDLNLFSPEGKFLTNVKDHEPFGLYWKSLHPANRWGGNFKRLDGNHYEMKDL